MPTSKSTRPALLLLEPDADVREVVADLLEGVGWRTVQAESESEALALLAGEACDAVLAHASSLESGELLRRARRLRPPVRIVLMTAGSSAPVPAEADALLLKPFSARQLREALGVPAPGEPPPGAPRS